MNTPDPTPRDLHATEMHHIITSTAVRIEHAQWAALPDDDDLDGGILDPHTTHNPSPQESPRQ